MVISDCLVRHPIWIEISLVYFRQSTHHSFIISVVVESCSFVVSISVFIIVDAITPAIAVIAAVFIEAIGLLTHDLTGQSIFRGHPISKRKTSLYLIIENSLMSYKTSKLHYE